MFTLASLNRAGYTGPLYIVIDNEDKTADRYFELYGDKVIVFDKAQIAETFDEGDNTGDRRSVVYARNACFEIAKELGLTYFMQLDDDYVNFNYRTNADLQYQFGYIRNLDQILEYLVAYYASIPALSIAIAQGGDYIGGKENPIDKSMGGRRKCMNTFICSTERPFKFIGRINEDVNTYTRLQNLGNLFLTFPLVATQQNNTQSSSGGMTELYLDSGTYIKSFYTVMFQPSSVKIALMHTEHERLHHLVQWSKTVPMIIREGHKKAPRLQP